MTADDGAFREWCCHGRALGYYTHELPLDQACRLLVRHRRERRRRVRRNVGARARARRYLAGR